ncbi:hypothetical protein AB5I41_24065 [Sphingomonas sp. MMS24-JH45]
MRCRATAFTASRATASVTDPDRRAGRPGRRLVGQRRRRDGTLTGYSSDQHQPARRRAYPVATAAIARLLRGGRLRRIAGRGGRAPAVRRARGHHLDYKDKYLRRSPSAANPTRSTCSIRSMASPPRCRSPSSTIASGAGRARLRAGCVGRDRPPHRRRAARRSLSPAVAQHADRRGEFQRRRAGRRRGGALPPGRDDRAARQWRAQRFLSIGHDRRGEGFAPERGTGYEIGERGRGSTWARPGSTSPSAAS